MIGDLKPHAAYKDSGLPWLGSIPAHWSLLRAKRLFCEVDEKSNTGKEELLSVSHLTGVTPRRLKTVTMFMAESNVGHKVCRPGDLVINTLCGGERRDEAVFDDVAPLSHPCGGEPSACLYPPRRAPLSHPCDGEHRRAGRRAVRRASLPSPSRPRSPR